MVGVRWVSARDRGGAGLRRSGGWSPPLLRRALAVVPRKPRARVLTVSGPTIVLPAWFVSTDSATTTSRRSFPKSMGRRRSRIRGRWARPARIPRWMWLVRRGPAALPGRRGLPAPAAGAGQGGRPGAGAQVVGAGQAGRPGPPAWAERTERAEVPARTERAEPPARPVRMGPVATGAVLRTLLPIDVAARRPSLIRARRISRDCASGRGAFPEGRRTRPRPSSAPRPFHGRA
jgi:hypothetical protein